MFSGRKIRLKRGSELMKVLPGEFCAGEWIKVGRIELFDLEVSVGLLCG
jgi:hypothetical protein